MGLESGWVVTGVEVVGSATVGVGRTVVAGGASAAVVEVVGATVTRLLAPACNGAGRSSPQPPTLPTAAVARRIDAAVATSHATIDTTLRFAQPYWRIRPA